jgi:hypothetical protein
MGLSWAATSSLAADRDLTPVSALVAPVAIGGVFARPPATVGIEGRFVDRVGSRLCLGLLIAGPAPRPHGHTHHQHQTDHHSSHGHHNPRLDCLVRVQYPVTLEKSTVSSPSCVERTFSRSSSQGKLDYLGASTLTIHVNREWIAFHTTGPYSESWPIASQP